MMLKGKKVIMTNLIYQSVEFGTPYMTNSFVGSPPTEFNLTANLTIIVSCIFHYLIIGQYN